MGYTNNNNLPLALAVFLAHDEYPHNDDPRVISATSLLKPVKEIILSRRIPKTDEGSQDITSLVASVYGTAMHNHLERAWQSPKLKETLEKLGYPPGIIAKIQVNPEPSEVDEDMIQVYTEFRTTKEFMGWIISGEFDFLAEGRLRDMKTTGVFTYISGTMDDKYKKQGSIYRWLNPEKVTDEVMAIDFIFTDWSALAARTQTGYPALRMMEKLYTLIPIEETERWIRDKLTLVDSLMDAPEHEIPPCTNEDLWVGPSKFKYYKNPANAKRATKVYDNMSDANAHLARDGHVGVVLEHKDAIKACKYCKAFSVCEQAQRYINSGELKM